VAGQLEEMMVVVVVVKRIDAESPDLPGRTRVALLMARPATSNGVPVGAVGRGVQGARVVKVIRVDRHLQSFGCEKSLTLIPAVSRELAM